MRLFTDTGAGAAPLSDVCGVVPDARNPLGERYTDVPARGPVSADAAAATTAVGPASARRSAARSDVTSGVAGAWYGCRFRDRGLSTAYTLYSRSEERRVGKEGRSRWSPDH